MPRSHLQLDSFLPAVLRNLSEDITNRMSARYTGDLRLSVTESRILVHLAEREALTATQIVEVTAMEKSKVSRALSSLEERGLISRVPSAEDQRTKNLALTERGYRLYQAIVPRILDWEKELLEGLEISEYRDLLYLLDKLRDRLRTME
jgi:DNA-binding MarR family transcriptional regulator